MKKYSFILITVFISLFSFGQQKVLHNQYGYIQSVNKKALVQSEQKLEGAALLFSLENNSQPVLEDTLYYLGKVEDRFYYQANFSKIKKSGSFTFDDQTITIAKNPYLGLYQTIQQQLMNSLTDEVNTENMRQLVSLMYTSFTDSIFTNNTQIVSSLLAKTKLIHEKYTDAQIQKEDNEALLYLSSTSLSFASFAEKRPELRKQHAKLALQLYIKAVELNTKTPHQDLKGFAAFQLYLIYKDQVFLKDLIHGLEKMTWPQNFAKEDFRQYYLLHFSRIYNITDGFLVKNVETGVKSGKSFISNTPLQYTEKQLTDYGLANLIAFQAIKDLTNADQLLSALDYMSGINKSGSNYFEQIVAQGTNAEKRKLLLLLNHINLMI